MTEAIKNYRNMVEQPWGKMFYDLIYRQLNLSDDKKLKILDFGAGFCLTSDHYAKCHEVTAIEPNEDMYSLRVKSNEYSLITDGAGYLDSIEDGLYDVVICHNVLEYVDNIDEVLKQLVRVLKPNGILSIVKHNESGKVMAYAVLNDNPGAALELLEKNEAENCVFGNRNVYDNNYLQDTLADKMVLVNTFGIRTFFGLSSNNEIKFTDEWYQTMLELETKAGTIDEYRRIAFFNHLVFRKK